jgi:hypothetical protein
MCEPYDPFDFPDLPDEAVVAIDTFLTDFLTRFQGHYFAQMHAYYHDRPEEYIDHRQMTLPLFDSLSDPPF